MDSSELYVLSTYSTRNRKSETMIKTVAAEDPDPLKVATVEKLGLWGRENINYVKAIKRAHRKALK